MVAINKKRISSELLHIALVIALLRGNDNRYYRRSPVISSNYFNDISVSNDIMGPSWAYSRTAFHNNYHDCPPIYGLKSMDVGSGFEDLDSEFSDEDLDIDLNIINQLRSLTLSRFNSLPRLGKNEPTFQDITAYLLSESTLPTVPQSSVPADVIEYEPPASPQPAEVDDANELSQDTIVLSPGEDSGHEETNDETDSHSTTSESVKEFSLEVANPITRSSHRRESHGFHSDSDEENVVYDSSGYVSEPSVSDMLEESVPELQEEDIKPEPEEVEVKQEELAEEIEVKQEEPAEEIEMKQEEPAEEDIDYNSMLFENWFSDDPLDVTLRLSPYENIDDQVTLDLLDHVHRNEIGGAAGIDPIVEPYPELLGTQENSDYFNIPDLFFEAERSSLEFYKKFNDISELELANSIAPQNLHEFDTENEPHSSSSVSNGNGPTVPRGDEEDAVPSSSSHDMANQEDDYPTPDMISAMFDDILEGEGDSGVFEFFETSSDRNDIAYDDFSENSHDSIIEESAVNEELVAEAEESSFSADMIQTAPIHASARPTAHSAQPRSFQVHARMPGLLRGGSMEQRWQDLANLLSLQSSSHDHSGAGIHQPITHHFAPHPYHSHHHHHHTPTPLHHSMHPPHFGSSVSPATPYTADTARSVLLQNATLPTAELNSTGPYLNVGMGASSNLGSAVASSMHLTNSSEPMIDPSSHYKMMDPSHDMLYYQNSTNEMANQTTSTDGFNLSSILNDDELQLMDMAMNEGMYTMRVMDNGVPSSNLTTVGAPGVAQGPPPTVSHNGATACSVLGAAGGASEDRMEASSDSAVSSMGSERVPPMTDPPMSDNEWVDTDSHPHGPHDLSPYSMDYSRGKLGGYDYYKDGSRSQVAQKKHHMFGKRFQQEQSSHPYPSMPSHLPYPQHGSTSQGSSLDLDKYSCSVDFGRYHNGQRSLAAGPMDPTQSNHTYALAPTHPENPLLKTTTKPAPKEKQKMKYFKTDDALSRDEKKARSMSIPITTDDIINLPMDEFNERLSKYDLSEAQLSLIRDIRRRGKNKVAAQNCRKRKLDQILQLADEVSRIREKKQALMREQENLLTRKSDLKERYHVLSRTIFQALRDNEGNPYSPYEYSLQPAADGSFILVPRNVTQPSTSTSNGENGMNHSSNGRRDKSKDENKKE